MPADDPFSLSEADDNWMLWPMKTWPLWIRIPLILLLVLIFGWIALAKTEPASSQPSNAVEQSEASSAELPPAPAAPSTPTVDCAGPFDLMTTTLQQFAVCAEIIGVERHELTCGEWDCTNRRGCPTLDDTGRLLFFLMPGEYIVIRRDGSMVRSDGELPADTVGSTRCERQPP